jgi:hypothetical protein
MLTHVLPKLHSDLAGIGWVDYMNRVRCWVQEALCAARGHDLLFHVERGRRICLRCARCGHETPGWRMK